MELYIESNVAYNELLQEMQVIDFALLLEKDGNVLHEVYHSFDVIYGMDPILLRRLGRTDKVKGSSPWEETLKAELQTIIELMEPSLLIVMWTDLGYLIKDIPTRNHVVLKDSFTETYTLERMTQKILGNEEELARDAKTRLQAIHRAYSTIRETNVAQTT